MSKAGINMTFRGIDTQGNTARTLQSQITKVHVQEIKLWLILKYKTIQLKNNPSYKFNRKYQ